MSDTVKVDLEENSKYRVALELMHHIAELEDIPDVGKEREYFLRLYRQCIESVRYARNIEDVIKAKSLSGDLGIHL